MDKTGSGPGDEVRGVVGVAGEIVDGGDQGGMVQEIVYLRQHVEGPDRSDGGTLEIVARFPGRPPVRISRFESLEGDDVSRR